jgi:Ca-activated chloride channel homolog
MKLHSIAITSIIAALFCVAAAGQQPEEARPISMGIVLDTSGSMGTKLTLVRRLFPKILKPVSSQDEFALIQAADRPVVVSGFVSSTDTLQTQAASITSRGRSSLLDAVYLGLQVTKVGRNASKVLLVISDGGENSSRYTEAEIRAAIRETGVRVYSLGIDAPNQGPEETAGEVVGRAVLSQIAEKTGGRHFGIDRGSNLPQIAVELSNAMRQRP